MYLKTGEFAALFSVEKSLLQYYDRIGLFSPELVLGNGYRMYSLDQTRDFRFILMMRSLNVPLDEIRLRMLDQRPESLRAIFLERSKALSDEIERLSAMQRRLIKSVETLDSSGGHETDALRIEQRPNSWYLVMELGPQESNERRVRVGKFTQLMQHVEAHGRVFDLFRGIVVDLESLKNRSFRRRFCCVRLEAPVQSEMLMEFPAGKYAVMNCVLPLNAAITAYERLADALDAQGLVPSGDMIERVLAGPFGESRHLLELSVPIKS